MSASGGDAGGEPGLPGLPGLPELPGLPPPEPGEVRGPMDGVPLASRAHLDKPLVTRLLEGLAARGDNVVLEYPSAGVRWTGAGLRARALLLAEALVAEGVRAGDRVAIVCAQHPEYAPLFIATLLAGAAWAPLNNAFDDGDYRRLLAIIEPRLVLAPPPEHRRLQPLFAALQAEAKAKAKANKGQPRPRPGAGADHDEAIVPRLIAVGAGEADWEALTREPRPFPPPLPPPPAAPLAALAAVCCSSGTSGLPKGVALSHFALAAALDAIRHKEAEPQLDGRMLLTSPAFWVTGVYYTLLTALCPLTLIVATGCDERGLLRSIHDHRPAIVLTASNFLLTTAKMAEAMEAEAAAAGATAPFDLSSLRTLIPTGAAMSKQAEEVVFRVFKCKVQQIYGMTEVGVATGVTRSDQHKTGSVGLIAPFMCGKVVDPESGRALGAGQRGELCWRGPALTCGYLRDAAATAALLDERGWAHSGDIGHRDQDGFFFVTGRSKDIIKYRGVHVSPMGIEALLDAHPAVLESAVVGVQHDADQEHPRAYVVLRPGATASDHELCALVQERLAPHNWLRGGVAFVDALPKTPTGKVSRAELRRRFLHADA